MDCKHKPKRCPLSGPFQPVSDKDKKRASTNPNVTVQYDQFGTPSLYGGTFEEQYYQAIRLMFLDRPFQLYSTIMALSGRGAEIFGSAYVPSDKTYLQFSYLNSEIDAQYADNVRFPPIGKTIDQVQLNALNSVINDINSGAIPFPNVMDSAGLSTPLPLFDFYTLVRAAISFTAFFGNVFSAYTTIEAQYLFLQQLITTYGSTTAYQIFDDLIPPNYVAPTSIVPPSGTDIFCRTCKTKRDGCKCSLSYDAKNYSNSSIQNNLKQNLNNNILIQSAIADPTDDETIQLLEKHFGPKRSPELIVYLAKNGNASAQNLIEVAKLQEQFHISPIYSGSNGVALSSKYTNNGNTMMTYAPQTGTSSVPGSWWLANLYPQGDDIRFQFQGLPQVGALSLECHTKYLSVGGQVGTTATGLIGIPYFQTTADIYSPGSFTIGVKGGSPVVFAVYRPVSGPGGFVLNTSTSPPTNPVTIIRVSNFEWGVESIGQGVSIYLESKTIKKFKKLWFKRVTGSMLQQQFTLIDNNGNIAYLESTEYIQFPKGVETRIPQGAFGNTPYYFTPNDRRRGLFSQNPSQGFLCGWNTPLFSNIYDPAIFSTNQAPNRQYWIDKFIRKHGKFSYEQLPNIFLNNFRAQIGNLSNNSNSFFFNEYFRCRFLEAVSAAGPNLSRQQAIALLDDFDDGCEIYDFNAIINSPTIWDAYVLASTWVSYVLYNVFYPTLGSFPFITPLSTPTASVPYQTAQNVRLCSLLSVLVGTASYGVTSTQYNYLGSNNLDTIIVASLDSAISLLGTPPYNQSRSIYNIENAFGTSIVYSIETINCSAMYTTAERSQIKGLVNLGTVIEGGQSEDPTSVHYLDQMPLWQNAIMKPFDTQLFQLKDKRVEKARKQKKC